MTKREADKRSIRNVLINRPLQREFTLVLIAIMMVASVVVAVFIRLTLLEMSQNAPTTLSRSTFTQLVSDASAQLVAGSILIIFLAVIATGFLGVLFLHRVAGPVYRFGQVLKRISQGETPNEIQLRPRDFFKELAEEINQVIRLLRKREATTQKFYESVEAIDSERLPGDIKERLSQIRNNLDQLRKP